MAHLLLRGVGAGDPQIVLPLNVVGITDIPPLPPPHPARYPRMVTSSTSARDDLLAAVAAWKPPFRAFPVGPEARHAAVLMLFGVLDSLPATAHHETVPADLDVLLQRRAPDLSSHPGQISFPGGGFEAGDADAVATALREAEEETGLDPEGVEVLAALPDVPLLASNHRVTPVLAWWNSPSRVVAVDHAETVEVFRVPVASLLSPENRYTSVRTYPEGTFRGPAFDVDGTIVWGFTAALLDAVFEAASWTLPWDRTDERPI